MSKAYTKEQSTFHSEREKKEPKAKKPIATRSKKRIAKDVEYKKLNMHFLAENPTCAVYPQNYATEVHHTYSGKDRDKYYLDTTTWLPVSREGHNWIHNNPKEAREKGYLK